MEKTLYIQRKMEATILKYLKSPEILAIVGPRQCGKTTLLRHIFEGLQSQNKKAIFLTFEDKNVLDLFSQNIDEFCEVYVKPNQYVFIDEFHYAKKGGKQLKYIFDTQKAKILVSGSSAIDLSIQAFKYLVGRVFVFSLFQLDFEEFLGFKDADILGFYLKNQVDLTKPKKIETVELSNTLTETLRKYYQDYLVYGGYPRVALASEKEEKQVILKNIYNIYFLREVKDILGLVDDYKLSQMIKALALQVGSLIEYREICQVSGLSYQTVKGHLNFLEKTFIAFFVKPYFENKRTEIVKNPKIYFFDTGLRNYIVNDFRGINERTDAGVLLENGIAMQLIKKGMVFNFWRTKQQAEVDFIIQLKQNKKIALEVKKSYRGANVKAKGDFQVKYPSIPLHICFWDQQKDKQGDIKKGVFLPLL